MEVDVGYAANRFAWRPPFFDPGTSMDLQRNAGRPPSP